MSKYETLKTIMEENEQFLLSIEGLVAAGIGYLPGAEDSEELCFHIYVESEEIIGDPGRMPREIGGIPIYATVAKRPELITRRDSEGAVEGEDEERYRPLRGGIQINLEDHESSWLGTLGTFVKSQDPTDDSLYILSNLHVLGALDRAVYQATKSEENSVEDWVATTTMARAFNNTDAALAKVKDEVEVMVNTIEEIGIVEDSAAVTEDILEKKVLKRGRTTRLTKGTIKTINAQCVLDDGKIYEDCVVVKADKGTLFTDRGDSGSAAVLMEEKKLVGLVFASDFNPGGSTYFCTIENVFDNLNVKLPKS